MIIDLPAPQDFQAKGDGKADDTEALQNWGAALNGAHGYVPPGTYCYSDSWAFHAPCRVEGASSALAVFRRTDTKAAIGNANMRWSLEVDPVGGGDPLDDYVQIEGVSFAGDPNAVLPHSTSFLAFVGLDRLKMRDVVLRDCNLDLLVLHNCRYVDLDHCELRNWGIRTHVTPGDGTYVGGCAVFCWHSVLYLRMVNCDIHDGAGGLWLQDVDETVLTGTRVRNTTEFDLVGVGLRSVVAANILGRTARVDVSGHNAELHGEEFVYGLNVHTDADGSNLYGSNFRNVILTGNLYLRPGPGATAITLASHPPSAGVGDHPPECVLIETSLCCDPSGQAANAIRVVDAGGGNMTDVVIGNNNTGDPKQWTAGPLALERKGVTQVHN